MILTRAGIVARTPFGTTRESATSSALFWLAVLALAVAFVREVQRWLFARRVSRAGLRVIAVAPVGALRVIAIEPPPGVSIVPALRHLADLRRARLLVVGTKMSSAISAEEVWQLTSRLSFVWYPAYRYMRSPGYECFRSYLQANHIEHAALVREFEARERREVPVILFAVVVAAAIVYVLWATHLIGRPVSFP